MSEPGIIRLTQLIDHPPDKVWAALTDPTLVARWWAAGDVRPIVGHRFSLDMGQAFGKQPCEVLVVEPERVFSYSYAPGTLDTTITWRLQTEGKGTRLFLEHKGFNLDTPMGAGAFNGMGGGWPKILSMIAPAIEAAKGA
jgi:uncharacterized protein YndB with AHSA1/START domain